jgi:hypothetical protein
VEQSWAQELISSGPRRLWLEKSGTFALLYEVLPNRRLHVTTLKSAFRHATKCACCHAANEWLIVLSSQLTREGGNGGIARPDVPGPEANGNATKALHRYWAGIPSEFRNSPSCVSLLYLKVSIRQRPTPLTHQ